jgi:putative glutamine amidotransferase
MNKPFIGVTPLYDEKKKSYWMLPGYMKAIEAAGGIPVMLPLTADEPTIRSISGRFDGFLFTGGQDVNPHLYGEEKSPLCGETCDERDALESLLFQRVIEQDKPVFGICRGIQLINVALGGTLYQDLPTGRESPVQIGHSQSPPYDRPVHRVTVETESPLFHMLESESLMVNSYHHQGIKQLSDRLKPAAYADDGLVEAAYMPEKTFVHAVQWHPEFSYQTDPLQFRLFTAFVNQCKK